MRTQNNNTRRSRPKEMGRSTCKFVMAAAWLIFPTCGLAQATINFEEHPVDTRIKENYSADGVHFLNDFVPSGQYHASPIISSHPSSPSAPNVLVNDQRDCETSTSRNAPLSFWFDNPMMRVSMAVGTIYNLPGPCSGCTTETATITFHGCGGGVLAQRTLTASTAFDSRVDYFDIKGRIIRVDVDYGDTNCPEAIDNLTFTPSGRGCLDTVTPCPSVVVSLSDDAPGPLSPVFQSFNETRGLDVTILSPNPVPVKSMSLDGLSIGSASSALVGARIYDGNTTALVASADVTIGASGSVTIPISAVLAPGGHYRLCFYVETTPQWQGAAPLVNIFGLGSYTESSGMFRINSAHAIPTDTYPANMNYGVPPISIELQSTGCLPELAVSTLGASLKLAWEDDEGSFQLQESENLVSWIASERAIKIKGSAHSVVIPTPAALSGERYFRLELKRPNWQRRKRK